ncbi:hypothetical protein SBY92_001219 [Candida maltosa Xu316]
MNEIRQNAINNQYEHKYQGSLFGDIFGIAFRK